MAIDPCLNYFVNIRPDGTPIPGTMSARSTRQEKTPCTEAWLPPYQMSPPANHKQCFPATGLRYWYQKNSQTNLINPNSLIAIQGKPTPLCSGQNTYLEYIIYS